MGYDFLIMFICILDGPESMLYEGCLICFTYQLLLYEN
jgi:hypothetical protein